LAGLVLHYRNKKWFVGFVESVPIDESGEDDEWVLGIDLRVEPGLKELELGFFGFRVNFWLHLRENCKVFASCA
jgi:hypothetical protein